MAGKHVRQLFFHDGAQYSWTGCNSQLLTWSLVDIAGLDRVAVSVSRFAFLSLQVGFPGYLAKG